MTTRPTSISLGLALVLGLAAGCDTEKPKIKGGAEIKTRETVGKTTQDVLKLADALAPEQGGVLAATSVTSTDYLGATSDSYKTSVAKIGAMAVEHTIQLRNASNIQDPKPLSYDEFMAEIIKKGQADGIQLAKLPYYQEYAWDEANQKLVVVEFPAKKAAYQKQQDKKLGRN
ncbi:MAG: hypothetical protein JWN86_3085 [Planctomycetota bacterium]|nr:hypothetical protein [Planctomycetota bacterium]